MAQTRGMRKSRRSAAKSYKRRVRLSPCRGKGPAVCRSKPGCKYSSGRKRSFCRKSRNTKRKRGGSVSMRSMTGGRKRTRTRRRRRRGSGPLSRAIVPFSLFGLKHSFSKRR